MCFEDKVLFFFKFVQILRRLGTYPSELTLITKYLPPISKRKAENFFPRRFFLPMGLNSSRSEYPAIEMDSLI